MKKKNVSEWNLKTWQCIFLYYFHNKKNDGESIHHDKYMLYPVATQLISTKIKLASKKIPYEPKPLLDCFVRLTIKWRVTYRVVASWVGSGLTTFLLTITPDTARQSKLFVSFLFLIVNICNIKNKEIF
jgi:hypothetical protein